MSSGSDGEDDFSEEDEPPETSSKANDDSSGFSPQGGTGSIDGITPYNPETDLGAYAEDISFDPHADLCKRRFLWYHASYLQTIENGIAAHLEGSKFFIAPFESQTNWANGLYQYKNLRKRLKAVYSALKKETADWAKEGDEATTVHARSVKVRLQNRFQQAEESSRRPTGSRFELFLVANNPFVWKIILYGKPSSNLDGGIITIMLHFPVRFPEEQPRAFVETRLFHHRISPVGGALCYLVADSANAISHLEGIIAAIEDDNPGYDPRTLVHPEAASLLWGGDDQRRVYYRRLRRSVQDSLEAFED